jgi:hypothetical protein
MAEIGKPVRRIVVIPEDVPEPVPVKEPVKVPEKEPA